MNRDEKFRRRAEDAPNRILDRLKVGDKTSDQLRWFLANGEPLIVGAVTYHDCWCGCLHVPVTGVRQGACGGQGF